MKLSIVLGFVHMLFGTCLSYCNAIYRKDNLAIYCVIIPQALSFTCFVGYLVFLIFYKWAVTITRPGIINVLVAMFTQPLTVEDEIFPYQKPIQLFLFSMIIVSIPWMLFSKPIFKTLKLRKKKKYRGRITLDMLNTQTVPNENDKQTHEGGTRINKLRHMADSEAAKKFDALQSEDDDEESIIDIWMHQMIESVEFCIGLISNTSSYLRLWAISLAHSQLTHVLHSMTLGHPKIHFKIIGIAPYVVITVLLLIGLEGLSACLHSLRLNWIEFNSRFYKGDGYHFKPLNFEITDDDE